MWNPRHVDYESLEANDPTHWQNKSISSSADTSPLVGILVIILGIMCGPTCILIWNILPWSKRSGEDANFMSREIETATEAEVEPLQPSKYNCHAGMDVQMHIHEIKEQKIKHVLEVEELKKRHKAEIADLKEANETEMVEMRRKIEVRDVHIKNMHRFCRRMGRCTAEMAALHMPYVIGIKVKTQEQILEVIKYLKAAYYERR